MQYHQGPLLQLQQFLLQRFEDTLANLPAKPGKHFVLELLTPTGRAEAQPQFGLKVQEVMAESNNPLPYGLVAAIAVYLTYGGEQVQRVRLSVSRNAHEHRGSTAEIAHSPITAPYAINHMLQLVTQFLITEQFPPTMVSDG